MLVFILLNTTIAFAQLTESPQTVTVDGQLFDAGSTTDGLTDASVVMKVQILNPAKSCILYEEQHTFSTLATSGHFNIQVGSAVGDVSKRTALDSANSMATVFYNRNTPITGKTSGGGGCAYTPASEDIRHFRFFVTPSTVGSTSQLSPDMRIDSVPQALVAQTLQGLGKDDVFKTSVTSTQTKLDNLLTTNYTNITDLIGGTSSMYLRNASTGTLLPTRPNDPSSPAAGQLWYDTTANQIKYFDGTAVQSVGASGAGITSLTAGSGLDGGTITTTGTISIATGGVTNAMLATGIDASKITTGTLPAGVVPSGTDSSKLPLAGGTMTGAITMGADTSFAGFNLLGAGHITMNSQRTITIGRYTGAQETTLISTLTGANAGATWYNSTTNKLMYWTGSAALELADTTSAGGDITAINTNAGSGLSGGATSGPITLTINVDNNTVEISTNTVQVKDAGITNAKLANNAVTSGKILDGEIVNADISATAAISWSKIDKTGATAADVGAVPTARAVNTNAGSALSGGGALTADRNLSVNVDDASIEVSANALQVKDGGITNAKIASMNITKLTAGAGDYFNYMPSGTECANGEVLKWNSTTDRWLCGVDSTGVTDHGALTGLSDDDHTQYVMLAGRAGGQVVRGGTASGEDITIESTSHATKGDVLIQPSGGNVGIGTGAPAAALDIEGTVQIGDGGETCSVAANAGMIKYAAGALQYCNGSAWQTLGVSGAGLTTLNGQTGSTQTFAVNASGTAPALNSAGNTHTISIPLASGAGVTSGTISKTDYDSFVAKLSSVSGSSLNAGRIWVGDAGNQAAAVLMSGDATLSNTGVLTIAADAITTGKIADGTITNADISGTAAIAWSKIDKTGATASDVGAVPTSRAVNTNAGSGLTGGGALTADRNIALNVDNSTIEIATNTVQVKDGGITNAKIATVNITKLTAGAGDYFAYMPAGTECANGEVLKWDSTADRWLCGTDSGGVTDHGALTGLGDDDHTQYVMLAGRAGGQVVRGGTASGDDITIESTSHATKGDILLQPNGGSVGIGTGAPAAALDVEGTVQIGDGGEACSIAANAGMIKYASGALQYCNGSAWQTLGVSGAGLTTLNGQTGSTQTFAVNASGTAPALNSAGNAHTISIPLASGAGVTSGTISKTDYDSFVAKLSAVSGSSLTSARLWVGDAGNQAAAVLMSGDATLSNTGALTIAADAITTGKIADGTITNADISGTAAIAWSKIDKTGAAASDIGAVPTSRAVNTNAGSALSGGGALTADRNISVNVDDVSIEVSSNALRLKDGGVTNAKIATMNITKLTQGAGDYFSYMPAGTECTNGEVLKWDSTADRWLCGTDSGGVTDHGALTGLGDDDHTQYVMLTGRAGGQSVRGGTASGDDLTLESTSNATKGDVVIQPSGGNVGIGTAAPTAALDVEGTVQIGDGGEACSIAANAGMIKYAAGSLQYCNGSAWQTLGVSGAGLTTLNGQTGNTQSFAMNASGTAPAINSAGNTHTVSIPLASGAGVTSGTISKTDYDSFVAKLSAVSGSSLTSARLWVGDSGNQAAAVLMSGDATLSNTGALTIAADAITTGKIADGTITNSDISGTAAIGWSKIDKTGAVASDIGAVPTSRAVNTNAGSGLTGGGALTADRNIAINVDNSTLEVATNTVQVKDGGITNAKIATMNITKLTAGAGDYFAYMPAGTECANGEVLKWDSTTDRWLCGADSGGVTDHGALTGLGDDDHTQYVMLAGRAGGQVVRGGTASGDDITIESTSHATKGDILLQPSGGRVGIGTTAPAAAFDVEGTVQIGDGGEACSIAANAGMIKYASGALQYCNGSAWQTLGVSGAGLTTLNGQTGSTQIFAVNASGTAPALNSAGNAHTISIPLASGAGVTSGTISKTDYDSFVAKLSAVSGSSLTSARLWVGDSSNQAAAVLMSGDATLSNTGALTIAADAITTGKIADGTITNSDISGTAAIGWSKIDKTGAVASDVGAVPTARAVNTNAGSALSGGGALTADRNISVNVDDASIEVSSNALRLKDGGVTNAKIATMNITKLTAGAGDYFAYMPAGTECANGEVLKWDSTTDRWLCGTDSGGVTDHGALTGLGDDDHTQYVMLAGRAGGQIVRGGTASGDDLTLESTSNATKGDVVIQPNGGKVGIGTATPSSALDIEGTVQIGDGGEACSIAANAGMIKYASGTLQYCNGSAWQTLGVSGAGLTTLNGQTGSTQTFAVNASGTAPALNSAGNAHTISIPLASGAGVTSGTISKTDYDSFVAKLSSVSGSSLTSARLWVGDSGNQAAAVLMSGDATLSNTGVLTISSNAIGSSEITDGSIGNADINSSAAIAWTKIDKTGAVASDVGAVPTSRAVNTNAGSGLTGGGALTADRNIALNVDNSTIEVATNTVQVKDGGITNAKIATMNITKLTAGAGDYFSYMPAGTECANGEVLKWNSTTDRWLCGVDSGGVTDHGALTGLSDDDHTQYVLLVGRAGGQVLVGGTASGDDISIESTSNATKGDVLLQPNGGKVGIGTAAPASKLDIEGTVQIGDGGEACSVAANAGMIKYASGTLQYCNGSAWQTLGVSGAGLTTLNGQTGSTQTFAVNALGTAPALNSASNAHTISIPLASGAGVTSGTISKTDYDSFVAKLSAVSGSSLTSARIWVGDSGNQAAAVLMSGDATLSNTGVLTISSNAVGSSEITDGSIVNADINSSAAIAWTKIDKTGAVASDVGAVPTARTISTNAGSGLTGGGDLTANRAIAMNVDNSTIEIATNTVQVKDGGITNAKIATVNITKLTAGAGDYFSYMPAGTECATGEVLKWNATTDRWECGTDSAGVTDHGLLSGLTDDDHTQYLLLAGRAAGQVVRGSTASGGDLTLESTSHATKGDVIIQPTGGFVGIGTTTPANVLDVVGQTNAPIRVNRDDANDNYVQGIQLNRSRSDATAPSAGFGIILPFTLEGFTNGSGAVAAQIGASWENNQTDDTTSRDGALRFSTMLNNTVSEKVRIDSVGFMGIGTTSPAAKLDVEGTVQIGDGGEACSIAANAGMIKYASGTLQYCNGSAWQTLGVSGAGLTTLNGQTGSTQTFAVNASGTAPSLNSSSNTHTISIPLASGAGVTSGTISKTDYDSFVAKLSAVSGSTLTSARIWVGDSGNQAAAVLMSGDGTLSNTGVLTISSNAIGSSEITDGSIVNADINSSAAIAWTKIDKTGAVASDVGAVPTSRAVNTNAGSGLTGGGALTADRNLALNVDNSTIEIATNTVQVKDGGITNAKIATVNITKLTAGAGDYFSYMPAGTECNTGEVLKWNSTTDRWTCGTDSTGVSAHSGLTGLSADDHTQYVLLAGRVGGQVLVGGTASGDDISIESTSHATKGDVLLQPNGGKVGIGTAAPASKLDIEGTVQIGDGGEACSIAANAGMIKYASGNIQYCNGSAWQTLGISGSGLTTLNGQTGSTQTFAVNASGTAPALNSSSNTHTISIPLASGAGVTSGTISKTDYDSFVAKLSAVSGSSLTSARIWVGDSGNLAAAVLMSGDGTLSNTGVLTISSNAIGSSEITDGSIVNADINSSAAIAWTKIDKTGAAASDVGAVPTARTISTNAGSGLTGGGDLTANRAIAMNVDNSTIEIATNTVQVKDGGITNAKIATMNITKLTAGAGDYFSYMPAGTECLTGEVLKWNATTDRWMCGTDTTGASAHSALTGLSADDHTQYVMLAGRAAGQNLRGGTASGDDLTLESTSHATKGDVVIQPNGGNVGIGTTTVGAKLHVEETSGTVAHFVRNEPSAAGAVNVLGVFRKNSAGAGADGIAGQIAFIAETETEGVNESLGAIRYAASDATSGTVDSEITFINYLDSVAQYPMMIKASGHVGIGTLAPAAKLDVEGTVQIGDGGEACSIAANAGMIKYASGTLQYCNGSAWQTLGVSGSGLTTLNGQTGSTQTFAVNASGTAPALNSSSNTHTISIPLASGAGVTSGTISKTDYDSFVAKLSAVSGSSLTSARIWVGDSGNQAAAVLMSGDGTLSNTGVLTISSNAIGSSEITDGSIVNADINSSAAIAWTKIDKTGAVASDVGAVPTSRTISTNAGSGLTGGGDLTANRAIAMNVDNSTIEIATNTVQVKDGGITNAKIATMNITKLTAGAGDYFSYMPAGTECLTGEVLKWNATTDRWTCGTDTDTGATDHGALTGLTDDDHTQYVLLAGRATGQNLRGGVASGEDLTLESTSHATKGDVLIQPNGGNVGIGTSTPSLRLNVVESTSAAAASIINSESTNTANTALIVQRQRADATAPAANFGGFLQYNLEGFTNNSSVAAGGVGAIWENTQANDTTDRDAAMIFQTMVDNTKAEKMRISSAGSLGIGTTNPATKLDVEGTVQIGDGGETCSIAANAGMIKYASGSIQYCNGSAWQTLGISGAGLTTLNGQTGSTQTFAVNASGTAPALNSAGNTHTISIPLASGAGVTSGTISKTDYDSFVAKLSAVSGSSLTSARIWVGDSGNLAAAVLMSGDGTLSNTGALTISANAIGSSEITDGSIVNADINSSAAIAWTKIDKTGAVASDVGAVPTSRAVNTNAGSGLTGGGALSADRNIALNVDNSTIEIATNTVQVKDGGITNAKIATMNITKLTAGAGDYFSYMPAGTECLTGEVLKWNATTDRWMCGTDTGAIDHGVLTGLTDDDHTQYVLLAGRATGQNLRGGVASGEDLTLESTSHATKGDVLIQPTGGNVGIGSTAPGATLDVTGRGRFINSAAEAVMARNGENTNAVGTVLDLQRARTDATAPGAAFAGRVLLQLEGFTEASNVNAATYVWGWEQAQTDDTTTRDSYLSFSTMLNATSSERIRINSAGNLGIGTTSPAAKLDVEGTVQIGDGGEACSIAANAGMIKYASGNIQYCNGSAWQTLGISGSGLTTLNGQTGSTQTFAVTATGTAPAINSATNTHTLSIPLASGAGVTSGTISKTDYDSFVAKLSAVSGSSLTSARIWVGDSGNQAAAVLMSGDATLSNTGALTIASDAISSAEIAADTIAAGDIATNAVTTTEINDGTIATIDIANSAVTDAKINTVSVNKIASAMTQYFTYAPNGAACSVNQVLKWQTLTGWECANDNSVTDHGGLTGLTDDDHTQYVLLAGRATGQNLRGGVASGEDLTLESTSHATKGDVLLQPSGGNVGIGTATPSSLLDIASSTGGVITTTRVDTAVTMGEVIGSLQFRNNDTQLTTQNIYGNIEVQASTGITTDAAAGRMVFKTTGSTVGGAPQERMQIDHNGRVGIGGVPSYDLHVKRSGATSDIMVEASAVDAVSPGLAPFIYLRSYAGNSTGSNAIPSFRFSRAQGVQGAEGFLANGSYQGQLLGYVWNGTAHTDTGRIAFRSTENHSATALGTEIQFQTVENGTTINGVAMAIQHDKKVMIGSGLTAATTLDVEGAITSRPYGVATGETGQISLKELAANGAHTITIKAPDSLAANRTWILPDVNGTSGQVLQTDGAGLLSWATVLASGSTISAGAGTVGAPSLSFSGDPNTGLYSNGADVVGVAAGGANVFNMSSAGLVSPTTGGGLVTTANGTAGAPTFSFAGDTDTGWWRPAADTMAASTAGTEKMRIESDGDVGIGTTAADSRLHVVETSIGAEVIELHLQNRDSTSAGTGVTIDLNPTAQAAGSRSAQIAAVASPAAHQTNLIFRTSNANTPAEAMRINYQGYVGVGTTGPTKDIHIQRTGSSAEMLVESTAPSAGVAGSNPYLHVRSYAGSSTANSAAPSLRFGRAGGVVGSESYLTNNTLQGQLMGYAWSGAGFTDTARIQFINSQTHTSTALGTDIVFKTVPNDSTVDVEILRILQNGNVGIGSATPNARLGVYETSTITSGANYLVRNHFAASPAAASTATNYGTYTSVDTTGANNMGTNIGSHSRSYHGGTGTVTHTYGAQNLTQNAVGGTITNARGVINMVENTTTGTITTGYGAYNNVENASTGSMTTQYASYNYAQNTSTGTVGAMYGTYSIAHNPSGTSTDGYGVYARAYGANGFTNSYGVYIGDQTGTNQWGIYQSGATDNNYLAGNTGIGTTTPITTADVSSATGAGLTLSRADASATSGDTIGKIQFWNNDTQLTTQSIYGDIEVVAAQNITTDAAAGTMIFRTTASTVAGTPQERMRISAAGNVGIGSNNPGTALDVVGTVRATSFSGGMSGAAGSAASPSLTFSGDADTGLYNALSDNTVSVSNGGAKTFDFTTTGLVSPTTGGGFVKSGNGTAAAPTFSFAGDLDTGWWRPAADAMAASTAGVERLRIDSVGNVGLGTTTPTYSLEIQGGNGTDGNNGIKILSTNAAGADNALIEVIGKRSDGNAYGTFAGTLALAKNRTDAATASGGTNGIGRIMFGANHTNGTEANILYTTSIQGVAEGAFSNATTMPSGLGFYTGSTGYTTAQALSTVGVERMRIDSNGNVGIGTSSPSGLLNLYKAGGATSAIRLEGEGQTEIRFYRSSADANGGNFEAYKSRGTLASPTIVSAGDNGGALKFNGYDGNSFEIMALITGEVDGTPGDGDMPGALKFLTTADGTVNQTERMRITNSGNVGIGSIAPAQKLSVGGSIYVDSQVLAASGGGTAAAPAYTFSGFTNMGIARLGSTDLGFSTAGLERMRILDAGNVGIGVGSPTSRLHVVDTSTATSGTVYGTQNAFTVSPAAVSTASYYGNYTTANSSGAGANNMTTIAGQWNRGIHSGTGTVANMYGTDSRSENTSTGTVTNSRGSFNYALNNSTGTVTTSYGSYNYAHNNSTGTMDTAYGTYSIVNNPSGTVTDSYGMYVRAYGAGTTTNAYGVYLGDQAGTNDWGIYQSGATDENYFAGSVGIGTSVADGKLHVNAGTAGVYFGTTNYNTTGLTGSALQISPTANASNTANMNIQALQTGGSGTGNILLNPNGGSVGVGGNANTTAILDLSSTTKGFLPPRMTTAQRTAISSPANGLIVYDTTVDQLYVSKSGTWLSLVESETGAWTSLTMNSGTTTTTAACRVLPNGNVQLKGNLIGTGDDHGITIATLPAACRPTATLYFSIGTNNLGNADSVMRISITSAGALSPTAQSGAATAGTYYLDGVTFYAQ